MAIEKDQPKWVGSRYPKNNTSTSGGGGGFSVPDWVTNGAMLLAGPLAPALTPLALSRMASPSTSGPVQNAGVGAQTPIPTQYRTSPIASSPWATGTTTGPTPDPAADLPKQPDRSAYHTKPTFLNRATRDRVAAYRDAQQSVIADAAQREADIRGRYTLAETDEERRAIASQLAALGQQLDNALTNIDASFSVAGAYTKQAGKTSKKAMRQAAKQSAKDVANVAKGTSGGFADRLAARAADGVSLGNNTGAQLLAFGEQLSALASQAQAGYGAEARMSEMELAAAARAAHDTEVARRIADDRARMNAELASVADMRSNAIYDTNTSIADTRYDAGLERQARADEANSLYRDDFVKWGEQVAPIRAQQERNAAYAKAMQDSRVAALPTWGEVAISKYDPQISDYRNIPTQVPVQETVANLVTNALTAQDADTWRGTYNEWLNGSDEAQALVRAYPWLSSDGLWTLAGRG